MRKSFICIVLILAAGAIMRGYWQRSAKEAVAFTEDNELYVEAGELDAYFELLEPFSETYMLFGATRATHKEEFNEFSLHAISMADLRPIYREHPDFYMCKSPGAPRAQKAVQSMNIIAADSSVLEALNEAVSESNNSTGKGIDRVAVYLEGVKLELTAAIVRKADEDILDRLPQPSRSNYFLVEYAEKVDAQAALDGS
jgi:hypothetical protein